MRALGLRVKSMLIVLGLFGVLSSVLTSATMATSSNKDGPGSRSQPIALGHAAAIGGGWRLRVVHVTRNANQEVAAASKKLCAAGVCDSPPPRGAQDFMVFVVLTYAGGGKSDAGALVANGIRAIGRHGASYDPYSDSCGHVWPKPSLKQAGTLYYGVSLRGNVCFQIAVNDAASLMLFTGPPLDAPPKGTYVIDLPDGIKQVWFALR
jgi:hypothetical protein